MTDEITLDAPETRLERFLAAAAGVEGITLDDPETRIERYLYKIAQGGGGSGRGILVVTDTDGALDKTWKEIYDAAENKIPTALCVVEVDNILFNWLSSVFKESEGEDTFYVDFGTEGGNFEEYSTDSASGYPTRE